MAKKLFGQEWSVSSPTAETYFKVVDDSKKIEELDIDPDEIISDQADTYAFSEPEEITDLTDDEAKVLEKALKKKHGKNVLEDIIDNPRLSRIRSKLLAVL